MAEAFRKERRTAKGKDTKMKRLTVLFTKRPWPRC